MGHGLYNWNRNEVHKIEILLAKKFKLAKHLLLFLKKQDKQRLRKVPLTQRIGWLDIYTFVVNAFETSSQWAVIRPEDGKLWYLDQLKISQHLCKSSTYNKLSKKCWRNKKTEK